MTSEAHIEIANDFFHDSQDLLQRYRLTADHFYAVKSKRLKLFLDLRMAAECLLKGYAAYYLFPKLERSQVIKRTEGYSHKIGKIATDVAAFAPADLWAKFLPYVTQLESLPVGLRYRLDGTDFRQVNEKFYYETVGSDPWLESLHDVLKGLSDALDERLSSHSQIVRSADISLEELLNPRHNKYAKR